MDLKTTQIVGEDFKVFGHIGDVYFDGFEGHAQQNDFLEIVLRSYTESNSVCIDVGANSGLTAFLMDRLVPHSHILCIEPGPTIYRCLVETLKSNALFDVDAMNVCVGASSATVKFIELPGFSAGSHNASVEHAMIDNPDEGNVIFIEMMTIDQIVQQKGFEKIDFIKIDVEGFEEDVLKGASDTLRRFTPLVYLEFNSYAIVALHDKNPKEFLAFIRAMFSGVYKNSLQGIARVETDHDWKALLHENMTQGCVSDLLCVTGDDGSLHLNYKSLLNQIVHLTHRNNALLTQNRELTERAEATQAWADTTDKRMKEVLAELALFHEKDFRVAVTTERPPVL